jgi:hypothetical protein
LLDISEYHAATQLFPHKRASLAFGMTRGITHHLGAHVVNFDQFSGPFPLHSKKSQPANESQDDAVRMRLAI